MDVRSPRAIARTAVLIVTTAVGQAAMAADDYLDLSLDELANATVSTVSKFAQRTISAPASVSVITSDEIRLFGYQTLGELLGSVRGLYSTYDRNYEYLGLRGFGRTSNFNHRFLLLLDGYRVNDELYGNAPLGRDQLIPIDLIDRVEIVRGPGSSVYGSNAFFGVINVISKTGADIGGVEAFAQVGSYDSIGQRITYGAELRNGSELLLSASTYESSGLDEFYFNDADFQIAEKNFGHVIGRDAEETNNLTLKYSIGGFDLNAAYVERWKEVPTASFGSVINQLHETTDSKAILGLSYTRNLTESLDFLVRFHASQSDFERLSTYDRINEDLPPFTLNVDQSLSEWWGGDVEFSWQYGRHHLIFGSEFRESPTLEHFVVDIEPFDSLVQSQTDRSLWATYVQDEIRLGETLLLTAGLRYDDYSGFGSTVNPRAGLVYSPTASTAYKFLYGTAFRAPSQFELSGGADRIPNPSLRPEEITTFELVVEHYFAANMRIIAALYRNDLEQLSELVDDPVADMLVFRNAGRARNNGLELEIERIWDSGQRLRASYAWQSSEDITTGGELANSPRHELKVKFATPLFSERLTAGFEIQYLSDRNTLLTGTFDPDFPAFVYGPADDFVVANISFLSQLLANKLTLTLHVDNIFDATIADPAGRENDQNLIFRDGRSARISLSYSFAP